MSRYLLVGTALLLLSACGPQTYNYSSVTTELPQLVVTADAVIRTPPDLLRLSLGVITEDVDAGAALADNNRRMAALMARLEDTGLTADDLATGQFQIRPQWSVPPRPTPANWQRQIVGYQVSNELLVVTKRIDLAGDLIGLGQQAGANRIGALEFSVADPELHRLQAVTRATKKAKRKAETLAAAAGVKLGEIVSLSLDSAAAPYAPKVMMAEARSLGADSVPVAVGTVDIRSGVRIVYRLVNPSLSGRKQ